MSKADARVWVRFFSGTNITWRQRLEVLLKNIYWKIQEFRHRRVRHFTVKSSMFARSKRRLTRVGNIQKQHDQQGVSG